MNLGEVLGGGSSLAVLGIVVKAAVDWVGSQRARRAAGLIAEGTVTSSISERAFSAQDAQIVVLGKQLEEERRSYDAERASYERRITARDQDLFRVTAERDALLATVERLRFQIETLQTQLDVVRTQLDEVQESIGTRPHRDQGA